MLPPQNYNELYHEFPKLCHGEGFELLRASGVGGKELELIDIPHDGYSVEYLQAVVMSAKIYIQPLQQNLVLLILIRFLWYNQLCLQFLVSSSCGKVLYYMWRLHASFS